MSRCINYLRQEGLTAIVKKLWQKIFYSGSSSSVFLKIELFDNNFRETNPVKTELLTDTNRKNFETIKFWDFVKTNEFIDNPNRSVVMLKKGENYIAYAAEEHEEERIIHGLGRFVLKKGQGWIGPVYVAKQYRGNGYNRILLLEQLNRLHKLEVKEVFTAINSQNEASLRSFKSVGFVEVGRVDKKFNIIGDEGNILSNQFRFNK